MWEMFNEIKIDTEITWDLTTWERKAIEGLKTQDKEALKTALKTEEISVINSADNTPTKMKLSDMISDIDNFAERTADNKLQMKTTADQTKVPIWLDKLTKDTDSNDFVYFINVCALYLAWSKETALEVIGATTKSNLASLKAEIEKTTTEETTTTETLEAKDIKFTLYSWVTPDQVVAAGEKLKIAAPTLAKKIIPLLKSADIKGVQEALSMTSDVTTPLYKKADGLFGIRTLANLEAGKIVEYKGETEKTTKTDKKSDPTDKTKGKEVTSDRIEWFSKFQSEYRKLYFETIENKKVLPRLETPTDKTIANNKIIENETKMKEIQKEVIARLKTISEKSNKPWWNDEEFFTTFAEHVLLYSYIFTYNGVDYSILEDNKNPVWYDINVYANDPVLYLNAAKERDKRDRTKEHGDLLPKNTDIITAPKSAKFDSVKYPLLKDINFVTKENATNFITKINELVNTNMYALNSKKPFEMNSILEVITYKTKEWKVEGILPQDTFTEVSKEWNKDKKLSINMKKIVTYLNALDCWTV